MMFLTLISALPHIRLTYSNMAEQRPRQSIMIYMEIHKYKADKKRADNLLALFLIVIKL